MANSAIKLEVLQPHELEDSENKVTKAVELTLHSQQDESPAQEVDDLEPVDLTSLTISRPIDLRDVAEMEFERMENERRDAQSVAVAPLPEKAVEAPVALEGVPDAPEPTLQPKGMTEQVINQVLNEAPSLDLNASGLLMEQMNRLSEELSKRDLSEVSTERLMETLIQCQYLTEAARANGSLSRKVGKGLKQRLNATAKKVRKLFQRRQKPELAVEPALRLRNEVGDLSRMGRAIACVQKYLANPSRFGLEAAFVEHQASEQSGSDFVLKAILPGTQAQVGEIARFQVEAKSDSTHITIEVSGEYVTALHSLGKESDSQIKSRIQAMARNALKNIQACMARE